MKHIESNCSLNSNAFFGFLCSISNQSRNRKKLKIKIKPFQKETLRASTEQSRQDQQAKETNKAEKTRRFLEKKRKLLAKKRGLKEEDIAIPETDVVIDLPAPKLGCPRFLKTVFSF